MNLKAPWAAAVLAMGAQALAQDGGVEGAVVPPSLLEDAPAAYPPSLLPERAGGVVQLELLLDETGEVAEARVTEGALPAFEAAALHAATRLRFRPATVAGVPVAARVAFSYRFEPGPLPQTGVLAGRVRSKGYRRSLAGARVEAGDAVAETDAAGRFELTLPAGEVALRVRAPGFRAVEVRERLSPSQRLEVLYSLEPLVVDPYETVVFGERDRAEVSRVTLAPVEARAAPGTMGDPFRAVLLLPGVGTLVSGASYPVVRGSQPAATGYYLDGVQVPLLFHLFLGPAVVHPDFIESLSFFPGGAPAQYGRSLGAEVDAQLARPHEDRVRATAYADLLNAGGFVEVPFHTGTEVAAAGRVSYSPLLLSAGSQLVAGPGSPKFILGFADYQVRVEQRVGEGRLRLLVFGSSDEAGVENAFGGGTGRDSASVAFHRADLRYRGPLAGGELEAGVTAGLDHLENQYSPRPLDENGLGADEQSLRARVTYSRALSKDLDLKAGADFDHRTSQQHLAVTTDYGGTFVTTHADTALATASLAGMYAQAAWRPRPGWSLLTGVRADSYYLAPRTWLGAVEPRLSARVELSQAWAVTASGGLYHQPPTTLITLPSTELSLLGHGLQEAIQLDLGAHWRPLPSLEVSADLYFNRLTRTVELVPFTNGFVPLPGVDSAQGHLLPGTYDLASNGHAYGVELLVRHRLSDRWFGWLSYSLSRSDRFTHFTRYDANGVPYATVTGYLPFAFDQTHIANLVVERRLGGRWLLGAVLHFNSGRPETGVLTSATQVPGTTSLGAPRWIPMDADAADRLPAFFRADVRVSRDWVFESFVMEAYLDVLNVTASQEVLQFEYTLRQYPTRVAYVKQPLAVPVVLPIAGLKGSW